MKEMTVQKMSVKKIHSRLKSDLQQCIEYLEQGKPEYVKRYFGTDKRSEIADKLSVICQPFSEYQFAEIEKVITELHSYFISKPKAE
jgi:hypothetical protein